MKKIASLLCVSTLLFAGCRKDAATTPQPLPASAPTGGPAPSTPGLPTIAPDGQILTGDPVTVAPFVTYLILSGQNFCVGNAYAVDTFHGMRFQAIFDSSCIYANADPSNQADINKLMGFSDSASHHHQNSARFGWNWQDGALRVYAYCYHSGVRQSYELGTVSLNEPHDFNIELRAGQYFFSVDNKYFTLMERAAQEPYAYGYKLLPYFGGDEPAPHDVRIQVREIE